MVFWDEAVLLTLVWGCGLCMSVNGVILSLNSPVWHLWINKRKTRVCCHTLKKSPCDRWINLQRVAPDLPAQQSPRLRLNKHVCVAFRRPKTRGCASVVLPYQAIATFSESTLSFFAPHHLFAFIFSALSVNLPSISLHSPLFEPLL